MPEVLRHEDLDEGLDARLLEELDYLRSEQQGLRKERTHCRNPYMYLEPRPLALARLLVDRPVHGGRHYHVGDDQQPASEREEQSQQERQEQ